MKRTELEISGRPPKSMKVGYCKREASPLTDIRDQGGVSELNTQFESIFISFKAWLGRNKYCVPGIAEVQQVIQQIAEGRLKPSLKTHIEHARHVKEIVATKEAAQPSDTKACPKCGSNMVLRTSKKGPNAGNKFWGCSAFPKCRTIEAME